MPVDYLKCMVLFYFIYFISFFFFTVGGEAGVECFSDYHKKCHFEGLKGSQSSLSCNYCVQFG